MSSKASRASKVAGKFVDLVSAIDLPNVFNPYLHTCPIHDSIGSVQIRRENLFFYVAAAVDKKLKTAWIGRDLGYRGGRRTGLPLTDEAHISAFSQAFGISSALKSTRTGVVAERTAAEIWRILPRLESPPFLWNAFPFHPFEPDDAMSNRCHTRSEFAHCKQVFEFILEEFSFDNIYALGNDAARALELYGVECTYVRHPSYGGQTEFRRVMEGEYGVFDSQQGHLVFS